MTIGTFLLLLQQPLAWAGPLMQRVQGPSYSVNTEGISLEATSKRHSSHQWPFGPDGPWNDNYSYPLKSAGIVQKATGVADTNSGNVSIQDKYSRLDKFGRLMPVCNIRDFGAVGDGTTLDTCAIKAALSACHGGGIILVPASGGCLQGNASSCYHTGAFNLTSHQTLHIEANASLVTSVRLHTNPLPYKLKDYNRMPSLPSYHCDRYGALVSAYNATDVRIEGEGLIEGRGWFFWPDEIQGPLDGTRPHVVEFYGCKDSTIENVVLRNSPFWTLHIVYSERITVRGVKLLAPMESANTDGVDIDSSQHVLVENLYCYLGDDCVAVKSGTGPRGVRTGIPSQHIMIRNITSDGISGIALGSEMSGGLENITIQDVYATGVMGIDIKAALGRGGYIRDVHFKRFRSNFGYTRCLPSLPCPPDLPTHYGGDGAGWIQLEGHNDGCLDDCPENCDCVHVSEGNLTMVPKLSRITFEDIQATGDVNTPVGKLKCRGEFPCDGISLRNVRFPGNQNQFTCDHIFGTAVQVETGAVKVDGETDITEVCEQLQSLKNPLKLDGTSASRYSSRRREQRRRRAQRPIWDDAVLLRTQGWPFSGWPDDWYGTPPVSVCNPAVPIKSNMTKHHSRDDLDSITSKVIFDEIRQAKKHAAMRRAQETMLAAMSSIDDV